MEQHHSSVLWLVRNLCPAVLTSDLALFCGVHPLIILVGTFIEELWVDLHEHLHGVVHHTMNCPV